MQRFAGDGDGDGAALSSPEGSCSGALGGMLVVLLVRCLGVVWWQNNVFGGPEQIMHVKIRVQCSDRIHTYSSTSIRRTSSYMTLVDLARVHVCTIVPVIFIFKITPIDQERAEQFEVTKYSRYSLG